MHAEMIQAIAAVRLFMGVVEDTSVRVLSPGPAMRGAHNVVPRVVLATKAGRQTSRFQD